MTVISPERAELSPPPVRNGHPLAAAQRLARANPAMVVAGVALLVIVMLAVLAPLVTPYPAGDIDLSRRLQAPSLAHWLGTDALGQDVLTQVIYGARLSLLSGISAVLIAVAIGAPIGIVAAYYGGWLDSLLMRTSDLFIAFPPLLLPIAITAALGPGLVNAMVAVGLSWFPWYARLRARQR